ISNLTATTTFTNSSCPGASSGTMTVVPTSGVGPYTFLLNPGAVSNTTGVFTGLGPGTYTVTYTDVNTCNGVATATIGAGTPITASQTSTATSCAGANNGSITVTPTSGTAPYTFALDGGSPQASGSFPGVSSGAHTVLVKDANGCTVSVAVTVGTGTGLTGAILQTPLSCPGANDGTVTLNPTSGVAPYTYSIDGGAFQSSNVFTGLAAGNHTVVFRDANNCQGSRTIAVGGGTAPTTTATSANTSCAGASNGVIVINPIAGSTYTINPGAISNTTGTFTGLAAGTYTLSIATAGGCAGVVTPSTVTINPGAALSTTATTSATCTGGNSGTITVASPAAGTTYTLNPGAISNTTGSFTGLAAGTYTISFLTPAGCTGTVSPNPVVTANPSLVAAAVSVPATCPGINNGSITVTAPTAGTTYTLNPGAVSNTNGVFTSLAPGNYTISFVATGGCTGAVSPAPVVAVGPAPTTTASSNATSCPGVADGTVTVTPVGAGTTYTINPGAISNTSGIFNNLAAGTYTVTFVTGAGCSGTVPVNPIVAAGPAVTGTATATNTSCPTVNNGTITVNSPTGAGTTYTLSPGGISNTTGIFTGLAPNTYTISFQTSAGCTGTISPNPIVAAGPALTSSFTQVNPVCANINDGVITIIPQTGTAAPYTATLTGPGGPYTYSGAGPISFANLAPGTYNYTYGENGGCNGTGGPVTLVTNAPIFTPAQLTNLSCNNSANGTVSFTPLGGVAPYQYSSNAGGTYQAANSFSGLTAGPHTFRIKDNVGCTKDTTITLTQPAVLTATTSGTTPAGCSNNDGTMSAAGAGGTAPYSYTIAGTAVNTSGASTGVFTGLPNGPYTITVTDAQGCTSTTTGTVGLTDNMFLTLGPDVTICAERSVTFNPQTNPETNVFTWRGINGTPTSTIANPSIKNAVATPLDTATYELHAQWGGCERRDTIVVNILRKPIANAGKDTAICNLTYAVLRGSSSNLSGTVNYAWSPAANVEFPNQAVTRVYPPGSNTTYTYTLTVTDNYGCNFSVTDQIDVRVQPPVPAFAGNDTTAVKGVAHQLTASGGDDYLWTPSAPLNNAAIANPLATLQNDQKFVVRVTDFAGCIGYDTVFVKVYDGPAYYIPNAFTPNGDGLNDVFRPVPAGIARTEYFRIFNRYGETIFESNQFMKGWDGTFKGKKQAIGAYVWIIKGIDRNGKNVELKGTVMLLQ
ncbi:MAG: T9SS type B sorting domain-containing protein, partial [Chitinophagaceae bacterium]